MTRTATGRSPRRATASVALFPFLAVLVCTMGALIVVLVILARQAKVQAAAAADAQRAELAAEAEAARELVVFRREEIAQARAKTHDQLTDARLRLGHVEECSRQLAERVERLRRNLEALDPSEPGKDREALAAERSRAAAEIDEARRALDDARQAASTRGKSFAILPFVGPHGTRRRPIYLECRADAVVLQPEGVELRSTDFAGPPAADNPLAMALRAAREHLAAARRLNPEGGDEPYPLLIVRPDGIEAYYAAREAMQSWASEFGYELVGEDERVQYPQAEPGLAAAMTKAVETARRDRRELALLVASPGKPRSVYRAAPGGGGLVREGGERPPPNGKGFGDPSRASQRPAASPPIAEGQRAFPAPADRDPRSAEQGVPLRPGEWIPYERRREDSRSSASKEDTKEGKPKKLADRRGKDWGLPDAARGAVPITRPIAVECHADRLVVRDPGGGRVEQIVTLGPRMETSIDPLVSAVWEHMKAWGVAGRGMYWRPVLVVEVAPGADGRYEEFAALLDESGLDVRRKGEPVPDVRTADEAADRGRR